MDLTASEMFSLFWAIASTIAAVYYSAKYDRQHVINKSMIGVMVLVSRNKVKLIETPDGVRVMMLTGDTVDELTKEVIDKVTKDL